MLVIWLAHVRTCEHIFWSMLPSIVVTISFAVLYGILEYYWIVTDRDVPFRYRHGPIFLGFYLYHLVIMFPVLLIVRFSSLKSPRSCSL